MTSAPKTLTALDVKAIKTVQRISADIADGTAVRVAILSHLCGALASFTLRTIGHEALTREEARG